VGERLDNSDIPQFDDLKGRNDSREVYVDGRIILKWIYNKYFMASYHSGLVLGAR
jgi:hypothetical protein